MHKVCGLGHIHMASVQLPQASKEAGGLYLCNKVCCVCGTRLWPQAHELCAFAIRFQVHFRRTSHCMLRAWFKNKGLCQRGFEGPTTMTAAQGATSC